MFMVYHVLLIGRRLEGPGFWVFFWLKRTGFFWGGTLTLAISGSWSFSKKRGLDRNMDAHMWQKV